MIVARPDDRAGESAGAQHLRAAEAAGLVAGVEPHVGQPLIAGELDAGLRVLDVLARAQQVGALAPARVVTAASTSIAAVATGGESTGVDAARSSSRAASVSKISRRRRSSACFTAVSAMISCSWFAATSACADTQIERRRRSDVDLGLVHAHQLLAPARSADRRASTFARADTRFQYAAFTLAVVCTRLSLQPRVGDVAVGPADRQLLARRRR